MFYILEFSLRRRLKYVLISFSTSTFDRITKARINKKKSFNLKKSLGPSSQVCRPVVRYRRNHGAPHWLLSHQWGGGTLLHSKDFAKDDQGKIIAIYKNLF